MGALKYGILWLLLGWALVLPKQDDETLLWRSDNRLSWDDFKGNVPLNARAAAITASGITYSFSTSGTAEDMEVAFEVVTYFYPTKSWYQPALCDSLILSHEQLHFDISELYARKLKKRLLAETYTYGNVKSKVKSIYQDNNRLLDDFQNKYDDETNFSRNREKQEVWRLQVEKALQEE